MFDTIFFNITTKEAGDVDFMSEIPCLLDNVAEHKYGETTPPILTGSMGGLHFVLTENEMKIKGGSLCKFHLGNNYQTMSRKATQEAIEHLSDSLHIQMNDAMITRMDIALNIILKHPTRVYLYHFGELQGADRLEQPDSIYYDYRRGNNKLCIYDKIKQSKKDHEEIPELYANRNVLRIEQRYINGNGINLPTLFMQKGYTGRMRAKMLFDEETYTHLLKEWRNTYKTIERIKEYNINTDNMKGKTELRARGIVALAKEVGGKDELIKQLEFARIKGDITPKQKHDIITEINKAFDTGTDILTPSEEIAELDKKISESLKYYR